MPPTHGGLRDGAVTPLQSYGSAKSFATTPSYKQRLYIVYGFLRLLVLTGVGCMKGKSSVRSRDLSAMARNAVSGASGTDSNSFYDCKSGVFIIVLTAFILGWIPHLGLMVAGFIGGRRGGSILRGVAVGMAGSIIVMLLALLVNMALSKLMGPDYESFVMSLNGISPQIVVGLESFSEYLSQNFMYVDSDWNVTVPFDSYATLIGLSVIGGVFADQHRKELRLIVSHVESLNKPILPRSMRAHAESRPVEFCAYDDLCRISVNATGPTVSRQSVATERKTNVSVAQSEPPKVEIAVPGPVTTNIVTSATYTGNVSSEPVVPLNNTVQAAPQAEPEPISLQKRPLAEMHHGDDDMEWF